ncbi:MAG: glycosyltransferase family 4 protein [Terriglobales bacterium]|jgi:glycosyltransferase involved in cell wall biosynthesis
MRVAFDLRRIKNPGIGRYMKCLVEALLAQEPNEEYVLILPPGAEDAVKTQNGGARAITSKLKYYSIGEQIGLPKILYDNKIDLLHAPHFMLPMLRPCASVVTIHDVIGLAWKEDLGSRMGQLYYKWMMSAAVRLADRIITDSKFSRDDIVYRLGIHPGKVSVIYPGISSDFVPITNAAELDKVRAKYRIEGEFIVYTGIYKPRKNHTGLLHAFRAMVRNGIKANLVLVGPLKEGEQGLRRMAAELGISEKVIFTGFVDDLDLQRLYSAARVYACPSLYEGFGFTVLEAMACGTPVVCGSETSLPEVAGDAALYADPRSSEQFAHGLYEAFTNGALRSSLIEKGRRNILRFTWGEAARETLNVYHDALRIRGSENRAELGSVPPKPTPSGSGRGAG